MGIFGLLFLSMDHSASHQRHLFSILVQTLEIGQQTQIESLIRTFWP